jgi:hypothetical protein
MRFIRANGQINQSAVQAESFGHSPSVCDSAPSISPQSRLNDSSMSRNLASATSPVAV